MIAAARRPLVSRAQRSLLTAVALASLPGALGCAEAPRLPPAAVKLDTPPPVAATPPPAPARWVDSSGATMVGPRTSRGTLLLLGGRRALALDDGALEIEKSPAPEPLAEVIAVPAQGATVLVGRGENGVYRFDDPLGPAVTLARSEAKLRRIGAGPGTIAVWTDRSDLPRFLDVQAGTERPLAGLPDPPLRALCFADERRGAAIFEVAGLATTTDGGRTWRPAAGPSPRDLLLVSGLRKSGDRVRAFTFAEGPDAAIDLDAGRLDALGSEAALAADLPILRWIRATGRDPLEALAAGGVDLPQGGALVASHGLLARIDPRTGALGDLVELSRGKWAPCSAARAGSAVWVACGLTEAKGAQLFDPFGVMRLPTAEGKLTLEQPPTLVRNGEADLRVSPSGGAMLLASCKGEETGQACVRQPDGSWKTIDGGLELQDRGAGPLADGRVAFLRGVFDGDDASETGEDEESPPSKRLHVAALGPGGKERSLATIPFTMGRGYVRAQSPIEEDADHSLHFVIDDGEGPHAIIVPGGKETPIIVRIPDATLARLHGGRGIAVGEGHVLASLDGGASWNEVPASDAALEAARLIASGTEEPERLSVSEAGARVGNALRLGWGPPEASAGPNAAPTPPATGGFVLGAPPAKDAGPERMLVCSRGGGGPTGLPPLSGLSEARSLLIGNTASPKTKKRDPSVWGARIGSMETVALMEEDAPAGKPASWVFRWHDPREIGGKVQSATVKPPGGAAGSSSLRFAASSGARALFVVRSAGKTRVLRVKAGGAAEIVEVPAHLVPSGEVVFGTERGEPIAWIHDTSVVVWVAGERPRAIAEIGTHAARGLGTPAAGGVPLLVSGTDWALLRVVPIPHLDKASPEKAPPPAPTALDGWTRLPPIRRAAASLPPCGARPKGARFLVERHALRAEVEGVSESASTALYDVRVSGGEACVAGLSAMLVPGRRGAKAPSPKAPSPGAPKAAPAPSGSAGVAFVRVDLGSGRAEGGARGLSPDAEVHRLKCSLAAP